MPEVFDRLRRVAVDDILAAWIGGVGVLPTVSVPIAEARGAVAAEPVVAPRPMPATAIALVDGRGVIAAETFGASPYAPADVSQSLAVRAGDPVRLPFDAVAVADDVTATAAEVAVAPGTNLRRAGEDALAGSLLVDAGERLGARAVAMLADAGVDVIAVRRPRIRVVASPNAAAQPAIDLLESLLGCCGARLHLVQPDAMAEIGLAAVDLVLLVGGLAIGEADAAFQAATRSPGWRPIGRPALRPGETVVAGWLGGTPALIVPSRLDDVLATALALACPLLDWLAAARPVPAAKTLPLTGKLVSAIGMSELALVAETGDGGGFDPLAVGSLGARALIRATHWGLIGPESEGSSADSRFAAWPLPT
ncbi:MAG: hypothetical protein P4L98_06225 [Ancalomicrobiaceae bacterium]|nr:hypothetical protein [Ancalomicrobiaceae bacterium]